MPIVAGMSTATTPRPYLSPPQAADLLGIAAEKVCLWIARGELRATNVATTLSGRPRWRIHRADLEAFLNSRSAAPEPPPATRQRRKRDESVIEYF